MYLKISLYQGCLLHVLTMLLNRQRTLMNFSIKLFLCKERMELVFQEIDSASILQTKTLIVS